MDVVKEKRESWRVKVMVTQGSLKGNGRRGRKKVSQRKTQEAMGRSLLKQGRLFILILTS